MISPKNNSGARMVQELGFIDPGTAANIASGFASLFQIGRGNLSGYDGRLGVDPVTATLATISAAKSLQSLFGGAGGAQAAKDAMRGAQASQFPPGTSFDKFLSMTMDHPSMGRATHGAIYDGRANSSWMLRNGIGSKEDYGAFVALELIRRGVCDPLSKDPNAPGYQACPVYRSNGINIFDAERLQAYYEKDALKSQKAEIDRQKAALSNQLAEVDKLIVNTRAWDAEISRRNQEANAFCKTIPSPSGGKMLATPDECRRATDEMRLWAENNPRPLPAGQENTIKRDLLNQITALENQSKNLSSRIDQSIPSFLNSGVPSYLPMDFAAFMVEAPITPVPVEELSPPPSASPNALLLPIALIGAVLVLATNKGGKK